MEHEGAYLGVLDQALAARNNGGIVIAQVKRIAANGSLPPQSIRVPGTLVDHVVLDPEQMQTTQTQYEPAISGELPRPMTSFSPVQWGVSKIIARRAAMTLQQDETVNLGFGISALVPYVLLEEGLHGSVTWAIEQGAIGGLPLQDFQFGCASNLEAILASPDQFTFFPRRWIRSHSAVVYGSGRVRQRKCLSAGLQTPCYRRNWRLYRYYIAGEAYCFQQFFYSGRSKARHRKRTTSDYFKRDVSRNLFPRSKKSRSAGFALVRSASR